MDFNELFKRTRIQNDSPDVNAVFGCNVELISGYHVERGVPSVQVADLSVDTLFPRGMWVVGQLPTMDSLRVLPAQTCAQLRKKRWSPVVPSRIGAGAPSRDR